MQLDVEDVVYPQEVDTELLGSGAVMAFSIITPMILLAYAIEGRKNVQVRGGCSNNVLSRVTQHFIFFETFFFLRNFKMGPNKLERLSLASLSILFQYYKRLFDPNYLVYH